MNGTYKVTAYSQISDFERKPLTRMLLVC